MSRRECFPVVDMIFTNPFTGISYHIVKVWYQGEEIMFFTLVDSHAKAFRVAAEWMVEKYKNKELVFTSQCNNWLGYEIGSQYECIYVAERRK